LLDNQASNDIDVAPEQLVQIIDTERNFIHNNIVADLFPHCLGAVLVDAGITQFFEETIDCRVDRDHFAHGTGGEDGRRVQACSVQPNTEEVVITP